MNPKNLPAATDEAMMNRRDFLRHTLASGAVLALGMDAAGQIVHAAESVATGANTNLFGPWLSIDAGNVITLVNPEVEYGQGTATANAMLLVEELDADWKAIRIVASNANRMYTNPGSGRLSTDGSQGMRGRFTQMRTIGAKARVLLTQAAAAQWNVPVNECSTANSVVTHAASGRTASYGSLVAAAARLPVPAEVPLRNPEQWRLIGTSVPRLDTFDKCTGRAKYAVDFTLPGLLHATFTPRPVVWKARVRSYDDSAARSMKGVRHVVNMGYGVAVLAEDSWTARKAAEKVVVQWDNGPAAQLSSDTLAQQFNTALDKEAGIVARNDGDVANAAQQSGARNLSADYIAPFLAHQCMEPSSAIAWVHDGIVEFWTPTASMGNILRCVPKVFRFTEAQIRIHRAEFVGGSFGLRGKVDTELEAMDISMRVGAPVHLLRRREEEVQASAYRPYEHSRIKATLDASGKLVGWDQKVVVQSLNAHYFDELDAFNVSVAAVFEEMKAESAFFRLPVDFYATAGTPHNQPYVIPNLRVTGVSVELPIQNKHWRSVGFSGNTCITECFLDELAEAAGQDPFEFRRQLLAGKARQLAVLDALAAEARWQPIKNNGRSKGKAKGSGWGMAFGDAFEGMCAAAVKVSARGKQLRIERVVCAYDQGITVNPNQTEAQIQGGLIDGLSAAMYGEITLVNGAVQQSNFHDYRLLTLAQTPVIQIKEVKSSLKPGSMTEMITPVVIPALVNAVYAATGMRVRELPLKKHGFELMALA